MLIDQVRMIRGNKGLNWDEFLKPEDWEVIMQRILPSNWYPLEVYQRCGWATFQVLAGGDVNISRLRGQIRGKELFEGAYRSVTVGKDPIRALERFAHQYGQLFNFSTLEFERVGEKHARIHHNYDPDDPANIPYCHQLMGHFDALVEITGGKNSNIELTTKQWAGAPATVFDITWE